MCVVDLKHDMDVVVSDEDGSKIAFFSAFLENCHLSI